MTLRTVSRVYGSLMIAMGIILGYMTLSPQNTGMGFVNFLGAQVLVISGGALTIAGLWLALSVIGGVVLVVMTTDQIRQGILREHDETETKA